MLCGEAELTFPKLVQELNSSQPDFGDIAQLIWRNSCGTPCKNEIDDRVMNLDDLLPPAYHLVVDLNRYFTLSQQPVILVDSGRGCTFRCDFCQTALLTGKGVRYRSVPSLVAELKELVNRYGAFEAYFVHDLFTARLDFVEKFCTAMLDAKLPVIWQCRCRIDQLNQPLLELMSAAGCKRLLYGIESGSAKTLQLMNKKIKNKASFDVIERIEWTVNQGILPSLSMVIGLPEESFDDLNDTLRLATEFIGMGSVNSFIQLMSPLPGTALTERLKGRLTYRGEGTPTAFSQGIEFTDGGRLPIDEELIEKWPDIFTSFQTVTPDHGDLEICVDVSIAYCKLLEVYYHSFEVVREELAVTHLEVFRLFRDHINNTRETLLDLQGSGIMRSGTGL